MSRILHVLPHPGGGGEALVDLVCELDGFEHERLYLARVRSPLRAGPSLAAGLGRLRRRAPRADLLHVIGDTGALLSLSAVRRHRAVFGTHGLHLLRRVRGPLAPVVRRRLAQVIAGAERTICSSESELTELAAVANPRDVARIVTVPNGIRLPSVPSPEERSEARSALGLHDNEVAVLYLGELEPRKHVITAVEAAERAASGGSPVVLLVAGDGPQAAEVGARSGPAVRPLGFRDDPELLLRAADVFVMPSEREGLSLAVLEAMAHGLAMVVSDGPGNPEAVGDSGLVVPVGDACALANAFSGLAADAGERRRRGAAARQRVERHFTAERFLADTRSVFDAVLGG